MTKDDYFFKVSKYKGRWAVYCPVSCTYEYIGAGRKKCVEVAKRLNALSTPADIKFYHETMLRHALED